MNESMGEAVIACPIRDRRTNNIGVQPLPNVDLNCFFALDLRLMVLIVSAKRALKPRGHVRGNRSINTDRTAKNKLLRLPLVRRTKQALCSFDVDFLEIRRSRLTATSDCRQMDDLLDLVLFENLLNDRRIVEIPGNYHGTLVNQRWRLRVPLPLSKNAHQPRPIECCNFLGDVTPNQTAGPGQQNGILAHLFR